MSKDVTNNQDQNVADGETIEETTPDYLKGVVIDEGETDITGTADEGDQNSDDANEGDQNSDDEDEESGEDKDEDSEDEEETKDDPKDKTKEDKLSFAFKKKQAQLKEEKVKRIALEQELQEKTQKLNELTKPVRPVIPEMPDVYDAEFAQKLATRDEQIRAAERYDQQIVQAQNLVKDNQKKVVAARQDHINSLKVGFDDRVKTLDLDVDDFQKSEKVVADSLGPKGGPIAEFLLGHDQGPLLVKHLSKNDEDMEKVTSLSAMEAAVYLSTVVVPKLTDLKSSKKISNTPRAPKTLKGRGKVKSKNPYLKGATFE